MAIHPKNKDVYFTDVPYGYFQDFRPQPGLQNQVYRFNPDSGAVRIAADGFVNPNGRLFAGGEKSSSLMINDANIFTGFTFSPDGKYAYVTDTGISYGFYGYNLTNPASMYAILSILLLKVIR